MRNVVLVAMLAVTLLAGCYPASQAPAASKAPGEPAKVTLAMGYIPSVQFAPFYVAQEKGYFKDAGLDVNFRYGFESDLLKLVGTNELPFMIGSGEEVILGRSQGLPVRYVMRWYRKFPVVLFAKAAKGIKSPADLVGKKVGLPGLFGASYVGWQALVSASGLDPAKVTLQSIGFTQGAAVSQDQVDAALDYVVNGPVQLRLAGEEVTVLPVSDYIDLPSNGIITNEKIIKEQPELVRALVGATAARPCRHAHRSGRGVRGQPASRPGGRRRATPRSAGRSSTSRSSSGRPAPTQLGRSDPEAWAKAAAFMKKSGLIQTDVAAADLFTNDFVR